MTNKVGKKKEGGKGGPRASDKLLNLKRRRQELVALDLVDCLLCRSNPSMQIKIVNLCSSLLLLRHAFRGSKLVAVRSSAFPPAYTKLKNRFCDAILAGQSDGDDKLAKDVTGS